MFLTGSIKFLKVKRVYFLILLSIILFLPFFILAETIFFYPPNIAVPKNTTFFLPLKINSANNLFAVSFDLSFDSSLVEYVSTTEGNFLSQGCGTAMLVRETSPGRLVFGLTRLGVSCGGVSGSGTITTLNFRSMGRDGVSNLIFSNNSLCILNGTACDYIAGVWTNTTVMVQESPGPCPAGTSQYR
ncbi:cohesin domain-containing protein [Patescibacteria group bacterium]|nr:cohesin domain-containing protein [Patescibacteria group bacterium]